MYALKDRLEVLSISEGGFVKTNGPFKRPTWGKLLVRGKNSILLLLELGIVLHSLDAGHRSLEINVKNNEKLKSSYKRQRAGNSKSSLGGIM